MPVSFDITAIQFQFGGAPTGFFKPRQHKSFMDDHPPHSAGVSIHFSPRKDSEGKLAPQDFPYGFRAGAHASSECAHMHHVDCPFDHVFVFLLA